LHSVSHLPWSLLGPPSLGDRHSDHLDDDRTDSTRRHHLSLAPGSVLCRRTLRFPARPRVHPDQPGNAPHNQDTGSSSRYARTRPSRQHRAQPTMKTTAQTTMQTAWPRESGWGSCAAAGSSGGPNGCGADQGAGRGRSRRRPRAELSYCAGPRRVGDTLTRHLGGNAVTHRARTASAAAASALRAELPGGVP
jgi:hypothetical protein